MGTKITVNLPDNTVDSLKDIASNRGITVTEALRQTIESQRFLDQEVKDGSKVLLERPGENMKQLVFTISSQKKR